MKKILAVAAVMALVLCAAAGCGQKTNTSAGTAKNTAEQTDASGAYGTDASQSENSDAQNNGEDTVYSELVDMDKFEGEELKSETDKDEYKGKLGDVEVTIGDAKVIEYNGEDVAVVSFEYKNNGSQDMPFTGSLRVEAYQNGDRVAPTVVTGVDGVTMMAMSENVAPGDKITVQTAYRLRDKSQPLVVEVTEFFFDENSSGGLSKTFEF